MPSSESSSDDGVELSGAALAALQLHFQEAAQPNSVGGAIHLAAVERNDTYRELFFEEEDDDDRRAAAERIGLRLLHAEPNIYEWRGFLPDADVAFLRELVYGSDPSAFIGSYTQSAAAAEVVTERRTSLLLSSHWWAEGEGQAVWQRMRARLTTALGLSEGCAENPQLVVYPGGAAFFRLHHDSGQWNGEEGEEAEVVLERDQHGAGRLCTAFLYLSTHEGEGAVGIPAHPFELEPPAPVVGTRAHRGLFLLRRAGGRCSLAASWPRTARPAARRWRWRRWRAASRCGPTATTSWSWSRRRCTRRRPWRRRGARSRRRWLTAASR